jgi:hypothetical protein
MTASISHNPLIDLSSMVYEFSLNHETYFPQNPTSKFKTLQHEMMSRGHVGSLRRKSKLTWDFGVSLPLVTIHVLLSVMIPISWILRILKLIRYYTIYTSVANHSRHSPCSISKGVHQPIRMRVSMSRILVHWYGLISTAKSIFVFKGRSWRLNKNLFSFSKPNFELHGTSTRS